MDQTEALAVARAAIRRPGAAFRPLPAGVNWVFEADGADIVRIARAPSPAFPFSAEARLLHALAPRVTAAIPLPWLACDDPPAMAYATLPGRPVSAALLTEAGPGAGARFAEGLGAFLAALHTIPPRELPDLLPGAPDAAADYVEANLDRLGALDAAGTMSAFARGRLIAWRAARPARGPAPRHNDLTPDNLLMAEDGSLAGVVDWSFARAGDPHWDFCALHWLGRDVRDAAIAACERAGGGPIDTARVALVEDLALLRSLCRFPAGHALIPVLASEVAVRARA